MQLEFLVLPAITSIVYAAVEFYKKEIAKDRIKFLHWIPVGAGSSTISCYESWAMVLDDVGVSYAALTAKKGVGAFKNTATSFYYSNLQTVN